MALSLLLLASLVSGATRPALAADRERLWSQLSAADFLSDGEKRVMLGFAEEKP